MLPSALRQETLRQEKLKQRNGIKEGMVCTRFGLFVFKDTNSHPIY